MPANMRRHYPRAAQDKHGGLAMISVISGLIVAGAGGASLWYLMPVDGQPHRLARAPFLELLIPVGIVSALAIGVSLIVAGVVS